MRSSPDPCFITDEWAVVASRGDTTTRQDLTQKEREMANSSGEIHELRVGVIGLGHMGAVFAENLLADNRAVTVLDRDMERARALVGKGAIIANTVADLKACSIVLTSLPDDAAVASVTETVLPVLEPGAVHVSTSTISAGLARRLAQDHHARGQRYIALPVLGNPDLAHHRGIYLLAGGDPEDVGRVRPVIERLGEKLFFISSDPGQANIMKLAANVMTAVTLQSMGEVLALLRKTGIDPRIGYEVLTGSLFDGKVHKSYGGKILDHHYSPAGLTVPLAAKDLRLALAEAEQVRVAMPVTAITRDRLVAVEAYGWSDLDWSALGKLAASEAGLDE